MALPVDSNRDLYLTGGEVTLEGAEATGTLALLQRIERSLNTDRDFFPYDHLKNRGYNVPAHVLGKTPLYAIRVGIEQECKADEQVEDASALVTRNPNGTLSISCAVASKLGNFTFTMTATEAAATLQTLEGQQIG